MYIACYTLRQRLPLVCSAAGADAFDGLEEFAGSGSAAVTARRAVVIAGERLTMLSV
jgi:hypothetical protein